MSEIGEIQAGAPQELPARAMLGLEEPAQGDWSRLRSIQFAELPRFTLLFATTHIVTASIVAWLFLRDSNPWLLAGWALALGCILGVCALYDRGVASWVKRGITIAEAKRHGVLAAVLGAVWSAPIFFLENAGDVGALLGFSGLIAVLLMATALILCATPLFTIAFAITTVSLSAIRFAMEQEFIAIALAIWFGAIAVFGVLEGTRNFLKARISEAGIAEKSEVVSLLLREFEENEADWLWQVDTSRRIRGVSPRFAFALGCTPEEAEGAPFIQLISGEDQLPSDSDTSMRDLAERLKRRESFSNLVVHARLSGKRRWWELSGTPIIDEVGKFQGFRGVGSDVTEQRQSSEKIAYLARFDPLTGLPNRSMVNEALGDAMRYARQWKARCGFLMVDLDRFKSVNDSLGHQIGDQMLEEVAARLKQLASDNELIGRLGGDEFGIVIRDASDRGLVEATANRVIQTLSAPYVVNNHTLYVGASVGSAIAPRDGKTVEELMRNADLALYRSKDEGGGEHFAYEPKLHASAEERQKLEVSLRNAVDREELVVHYQPVVDAKTEEVVSFEALVRWNSPEHGFVSPGKFIPLAEDTRLIVPIGQWVMEQACIEAQNWPEDVRIAVNVSPEQLVEPDFASTVVRALAKTGLSAERLELEVTESIFLRDASIAASALEGIMALGCTVALDDFGTGYSSLGYLRKLRFSTIKVDRSFVQGAAQESAESLAIIRAVVAMADSLEMSTTAEGVETAEEAALIRGLGCRKIQGFHFGRPMPAQEVAQLFRREKRASA